MRANTAEKWLQERVRKYGPVSKLSLFGKPTVFIHGQAANKLVFAGESGAMAYHQTASLRAILGERNLLELSGDDHKRVREALVLFLKPDCLKQYVGEIEGEIRRHLEMHWQGKEQVEVSFIEMTFNIICSLLFGVEFGSRRDELINCFQAMIKGIWAIPINLPFTRYNKSICATTRAREIVRELIREKRVELEQKGSLSSQDLITCLLGIRGKDGVQLISEDEIVHNVMLVMVAGYDTSSVLITFIVRVLANEPSILAGVTQGMRINMGRPHQDEIQMESCDGDLASVSSHLRRFQKDHGCKYIPRTIEIDPLRFENHATIPPYCFVPFGGGARICPGYEFARIETLVTLHYLVTRFTWKLCCKDDKFRRDPSPVPTQGLPIQIIPKNVPQH